MARTPEGMERRRAAQREYQKARYAAHKDEWRKRYQTKKEAETPEEREARLAKSRAHYVANREQILAAARQRGADGYFREWTRAARAKDPERFRRAQRAWRMKSKYGIDIGTYEAMHDAQGGLCAICRRPETMQIKGVTCVLALDHDHGSGRVRGLLCVNCNMLIGGADHDPDRLRAAIAYLER